MARPVGSKKGGSVELRLDLVATLRAKGFDPVAKLIEIHDRAIKQHEKRVRTTTNGFGGVGYLQIAEKAAADILPYTYHALKAVEVSGVDGKDLFQSFNDMVKRMADEGKLK